LNRWHIAANLLIQAADTIRQRGSLRDDDSGADLIDLAAGVSGKSPDAILDAMLAIKHVRWMRAGDLDSAIDFLAYKARAFANGVTIPADPEAVARLRAAFVEAMEARHADDVDTLRAGGTE
jgi:hypothetical protein